MEIIIRLARKEEAGELAKIEAACFPPAEAASEKDVLERMEAFPENFLVAEKEGKLVGFINGGTTDRPYLPDEFYHNVQLHKPEGAYQTVFGLNVLPDYRRQGIAERLVDGFLQLARERGKKGVILTCKEHMIHYYEKRGFVKFGVSDSIHGGATWYDMRCLFDRTDDPKNVQSKNRASETAQSESVQSKTGKTEAGIPAVKTGLVLEGGGMRGIYTAGVLDVFMEQGISFDGVIGVSAGAIHGSSYVAGQHGRSIRYYKKYCNNDHFMSYKSLLRTGDVVEKKFCYYDLPERLDPFDYQAFKTSKTKFYVTCSNLETGKAEYPLITDMRRQVELMRASASLPYLSRIVKFDGKKLLDGGCTDSIPVKAFRRMGYKKIVVVLTRPQGYRKEPEKRDLSRIMYRRYPQFGQALRNRYKAYNRTLAYIRKLEKRGKIFVIRPSENPGIGRMEHDPEKIQRVYDMGRRDAIKCADALKKWMSSGNQR